MPYKEVFNLDKYFDDPQIDIDGPQLNFDFDNQQSKKAEEDYLDDLDFEDDDENDYESFSTVPLSTFDKKNRLDYISLMKDYHSGNERKRQKAIETIIGDLTGLVLYIIKISTYIKTI